MTKGIEAIEGKEVPFVAFNLNQAPFSDTEIKEFDSFVKRLFPLDFQEVYSLKCIVRSDRLYIFPNTLWHLEANEELVKMGAGKILQSAGTVRLIYDGDYTQRVIEHYSDTLAIILPKSTSDRYKIDILKPKLAPHFRVR